MGCGPDRRSQPRRWLWDARTWLGLLCGALGACGSAETSTLEQASLAQEIVNGEDDRHELYELAVSDVRSGIQASAAAIMWAHRIEFDAGDQVALRSSSLAHTLNVCEEEPFSEQPAAALCSASLIDDDLVLTAGHCLGDTWEEAEDRCRRLWVVFDYVLHDQGQLALEAADSVYACRQVAYHSKLNVDDDFLDVAVLQLERSAVDDKRTPIPLAVGRPEPGDRILTATHGAGLPLKVDDGGVVLDVPSAGNYFVADTDSFAGGSGGPLYNADMQLIGHQVRGERDWVFEDGCAHANQEGEGKEQHQIVERSLAALCEAGWPSERLCGTAGSCGDEICNGGETATNCAQDCQATVCGDAVCERSERQSCAEDCAAFSNVPISWSSDPITYQLGRNPDPEPMTDTKSQRRTAGGCSIGGDARRVPGVGFGLVMLGLGWLLRRNTARLTLVR